MSQLLLTCLGDFQVALAGEPLTSFQTEKVRALLVYLAVERQPHLRSELAQLLWPGYSEESANNSLRQALHRLRQILHDATTDPPWLLSAHQTVQFNPAASIQVDATIVTKLIAECTDHPHAQLVTCQPCLDRLRHAVALYRGDFLAGFTVADSAPFEEWRRIVQEQLHLQLIDALTQLANAAEAAGDDEQALQDSRRQLVLEPWLEEAHRRVMRILAQRGQRAAAIAQYQRCRQVLAEEMGTAPDQETTALYEQIHSGSLDRRTGRGGERETRGQGDKLARGETFSLSPPLPVSLTSASSVEPSPSPAHNFPAVLNPLVGRTQALAAIGNQLQLPDVRLLTLVGPGGMGKTRLALEVGRDLLTAFADGVFFVPLAAISTPAALAPAIATAIGYSMQGGEPRTMLLEFLQHKQMLLILDNFEHLLISGTDAVDLVVDLLGAAPALQMIVTSRERLKLRAEQLYSMSALAFSPHATLAEASASSAVRLFVQCVQRTQANFQLTAANLAAVLHICDLVQGMPLGLEMAAAWCDALALDEIADEIERNIDFLALDHHDLPERQRSMRAVFAWSWRLLSEDEARVLRQLAVFRGGFTRQAAESICGASLRALTGLVNKSLLRYVLPTPEPSATSTGRYELHELLRQFADEQLRALPDEQTKTANRHSEFYLAFVAQRERRLLRNEPSQAVIEIQTELANVRQAWSNAVHNCANKPLDLGAYGLWGFYRLAGLTAEGVQAFRQAATALQVVPADKLAEATAQPPLSSLSKLWALAAHLLCGHGNYDEALEAAQRSISLANTEQSAADQPATSQAAALGHLAWGQALYHKNQLSEAQTHNEQTLQITLAAQHARLPDEIWPEIEVQARLYLSAIARDLGDYRLAQSLLEDCLRLCQRLGKIRGEVNAQLNLGYTAWFLREQTMARQAYEQVLPLTIALHYHWGEGVARYELALVVRDLGEYSLAIALCEQALPIFIDINERLKQIYVVADLIQLYSYLGHFVRAADYQAQLLSMMQHFKAPDAERALLVASAMLAHYQGNHEQAFAHAYQLWQLVQLTDSRVYQAEALILLGQAQVGLQRLADAAESYTQALAVYQTLGALAQAAEAQAGLAGIALAQGDHTQAQQQIEAVLTTLEQVPNAGLYEPFLVYLTCYRVLTATHDARARAVLQRANALLQQYAAHIDQEDLRDSFLHNVAVHRQLVVTYEAALKADQGLPIFHTAFIGRQGELAEILAKLQQPEARLLTLVGPGGMGKTRLAVEAAKYLATDQMPDGRFFVSLAGLTDPTGLAAAISASLGLDANGGDLQQTLLRSLADRRLLLILDNLEQLLPAGLSSLPEAEQRAAVTLIMELLQRAPGVKILVTSRQRLGLSSEHLYAVQGMEFAGGPNDRSASDSAAVRLFIQSAQRTQPHYQVSSTELTTLLAICQLVQGMPLALEMAAAWVDQLSLIEIAAEINKSIDFLATEWRDMPERQRSLRTVFAWSWQLLNAAERQLVRRIALFRGGFTRQAAQAVADATLPSLTRLIHKSLLQWQGNSAGGGRYVMHELLRQFAAEEAVGELDAAEYAAVEAQHGRYYLAFVAERGLRLGRGEPKEASAEIQTEFDNVRQAWQWAGRAGDFGALEPAIYGWWQFCLFRGLEAVSRSTFAQAIEGVRQRLADLRDGQVVGQQAERVLSKLLALHANMLFAQGQDQAMAAQAREAIALGVASGGVEGETFGSFVLGRALQELDQLSEAGVLWQKTIQLARTYQTDYPDRELLHEAELLALHWLRGYALHFDDFARGRAYLVQALQLCQALGKQQGELMCNVSLAWTNFRMGDYTAAEQGFRESLHLAGTLGYTFAEMTAQQGLGEVARLRGDYAAALALLHQAARGAADIGYPYEEVMTLSLLIRLYGYLGDAVSGQSLAQQLSQLLSATSFPKECHMEALLAFAIRALMLDDPPRALAYAQQAWQIIQTGEPLDRRADAAVILGHTQLAMQQWAEATASYQQAIACYTQLGNLSLAVGAQAGLAAVSLAQAEFGLALQQVEAILPLLVAQPIVGMDQPFFVYLTCYRVLAANQDPRAAQLVDVAHTRLQTYAARIHDEPLRHLFLEKVAVHRQLQQLYKELAADLRSAHPQA